MKINNKSLIILSCILIVLIATITVPKGLLDATDVKDYTDTARFFAGEYNANQRESHSVLYGLLLSPYIKLTHNYFLIKFSSAFFLILLILSIYYISGKRRETLLLTISLPLIWFMPPWISPLPLVALLFLWAWFFIKKFDEKGRVKDLLYSGLLIGAAGAFWDTAFYFSFIFLISFLYNKKLYHSILFLIAVFIGLLPNFIVDYLIFEFPFYSKLKHFSAVLAFALYNGSYGQGFPSDFFNKILVLFFVPWYSFVFFKKKNFIKEKKTIIFLILSILFILTNSQIRLLLVVAPIIIILLGEKLNEKQIKIQMIVFIVLSLLVVSPYLVQTKYETNLRYFAINAIDIENWHFQKGFTFEKIQNDLAIIEKEIPNQEFIVFGERDDYRELAHYYWGDGIKKFISIEDYELFLKGEDTIASKEISSNAPSDFRRELFFEIGLRKNKNDDTDYENLGYGLILNDRNESEIPDEFVLDKEYSVLKLFKKI